jgi:hypothetical protein
MIGQNSLKRQIRMASVQELAVAYLSMLPSQALESLGLPSDVMSAIRTKRMDDDYVGQAAAMAAFAFSNNANTPTDRFVAAQMLILGSGCMLRAKPFGVGSITGADKDKLQDLLVGSFNVIRANGSGIRITGDAILEELDDLSTRAEKYNRYIQFDADAQNDFADVKEEELGTASDVLRDAVKKVGSVINIFD